MVKTTNLIGWCKKSKTRSVLQNKCPSPALEQKYNASWNNYIYVVTKSPNQRFYRSDEQYRQQIEKTLAQKRKASEITDCLLGQRGRPHRVDGQAGCEVGLALRCGDAWHSVYRNLLPARSQRRSHCGGPGRGAKDRGRGWCLQRPVRTLGGASV